MKAQSKAPQETLGRVSIKPKNKDHRNQEHLTPSKIGKLIAQAIKLGGQGYHRNASMMLMAYRHGLRTLELITLRCSQIDLNIYEKSKLCCY